MLNIWTVPDIFSTLLHRSEVPFCQTFSEEFAFLSKIFVFFRTGLLNSLQKQLFPRATDIFLCILKICWTRLCNKTSFLRWAVRLSAKSVNAWTCGTGDSTKNNWKRFRFLDNRKKRKSICEYLDRKVVSAA